jgi:hypothetical protein
MLENKILRRIFGTKRQEFKRMVYGGRDITTSCTTYIMTLKFPKNSKFPELSGQDMCSE